MAKVKTDGEFIYYPNGMMERIASPSGSGDASTNQRSGGKEEVDIGRWLPLLMGGGGALLANSIVSPMFDKSEEERRKESIWSKVLSTLIPIGVSGLGGYAGYLLGKEMNKSGQANMRETEIPGHVVTNVHGKPFMVPESMSQKDFSAWQGKYHTSDPAEALSGRKGTQEELSDALHAAGYAGPIGLLAAGAATPWAMFWNNNHKREDPAVLKKNEEAVVDAQRKFNSAEAKLKDSKIRAAAKAGLHKKPGWGKNLARIKAMIVDDSVSVARRAYGNARTALNDAKRQLPVGRIGSALNRFKLPLSALVTSGLGYVADAVGDSFGRDAMATSQQIEQLEEIKRKMDDLKKTRQQGGVAPQKQ